VEIWQIGLIVLALAWAAQAYGTWRQMRHYSRVLGSIAQAYRDGHLGAGNARGTLGKGVIAIVVVDDQDVVRKLMLMEGRSVFAKFRDFPQAVGRPLADIVTAPVFPEAEAGRNKAVAQAIEQVIKTKADNAVAVAPAAA